MARHNKGTLYKRGKIYWLEYYVNNERIRESLKTSNLKEAQSKRDIIINDLKARKNEDKHIAILHRVKDAEHARIEAEQKLQDFREENRTKLKITDVWEHYLASKERPQSGQGTLKDYDYCWRKFVMWWSNNDGDQRPYVEDIKKEDASKFARFLDTEQLSPNRYNKIIISCKLVLNVIAPLCNDMANPFAGIRNKRLDPQGHRKLTVEELRIVCGKATGEMRVLFAIGLFTALRMGDCCTLQWNEISLELDRIVRKPNKVKSRKKKNTLIIPLHPDLRKILVEIPQDTRQDYVLPEYASLYLRDRGAVSKKIQQHFTDCGIDTKGGRTGKNAPPEVGFHSLRHTFVSMAAQAGVPLPIIQELCGHESSAIQQVYLHMGEDATRQAILALPNIGNPVNDNQLLPMPSSQSRNQEAIALLNSMNAKNWDEIKDKVIRILSS